MRMTRRAKVVRAVLIVTALIVLADEVICRIQIYNHLM